MSDSLGDGFNENLDPNQLPPEDTLDGELNSDVLDESYIPPDTQTPAMKSRMRGNDEDGDTLDARLRQEEPEVDAVGDETSLAARDIDGLGRLVAPDEGSGFDDESAEVATEVDGGADFSPEESAMHLTDEDLEV